MKQQIITKKQKEIIFKKYTHGNIFSNEIEEINMVKIFKKFRLNIKNSIKQTDKDKIIDNFEIIKLNLLDKNNDLLEY